MALYSPIYDLWKLKGSWSISKLSRKKKRYSQTWIKRFFFIQSKFTVSRPHFPEPGNASVLIQSGCQPNGALLYYAQNNRMVVSYAFRDEWQGPCVHQQESSGRADFGNPPVADVDSLFLMHSAPHIWVCSAGL